MVISRIGIVTLLSVCNTYQIGTIQNFAIWKCVKTNQDMMLGPYAGVQCTNIYVATLAWWYKYGMPNRFPYEVLDGNLRTGDKLHTYLRDKLQVSKDIDGRVALDNLPREISVSDMLVKKEDLEVGFLCHVPGGFDCFRSVKDVLLSYASAPCGILVTIDNYTHAVFYHKNGMWSVFDSHGYVRFRCRIPRRGASVWEFASVDGVIGFLAVMNRNGEYNQCELTKPTLVPLRSESQPDLKLGAASLDVNKTRYLDIEEEEEDPYVSLMGGF